MVFHVTFPTLLNHDYRMFTNTNHSFIREQNENLLEAPSKEEI